MNLVVINIAVLFLCIGVTYSSPAVTSSSNAAHEEKPPATVSEVQTDHDKVQPAQPTQTLQPVTPAISTVASSSVKVETPVAEENKTTVKSQNKTKPAVTTNKNTTNDAKNTSLATEATPKLDTTLNNSITPAPIQTTTTTQKNTTACLTPTAASVLSVYEHIVPTPTAQERQFDGPSFVGGIVLMIGLTAIGFIAFKFYKSGKIERNYRTL